MVEPTRGAKSVNLAKWQNGKTGKGAENGLKSQNGQGRILMRMVKNGKINNCVKMVKLACGKTGRADEMENVKTGMAEDRYER